MPVHPSEAIHGPQALDPLKESLHFVKEHASTFLTSLEEIISYVNQTRASIPEYARDKTIPIPEHHFQSEDEERPLADPKYELQEIQNIFCNAKHCRVNGVNESTWNARVHAKIFDLAIRNSNNVGVYSLGSVLVPDAWRPKIPRIPSGSGVDAAQQGGSEQSRSSIAALGPHVIDFLLYLEDSKRTKRIVKLLQKECLQYETVNHFHENALALFPTGVFVKTKGPKGTKQKSEMQMRSWISSWHIRMSSFLTRRPENCEWPVLPTIHVSEDTWELEIAKYVSDTSDVRVAPRFLIGDTFTPRGMYQLLAVLRVLVAWMETGFANWFDGVLDDAGV
jgi:hypothetical protein